METKNKLKSYDKAFKLNAVNLYLSSERSIKQLSHELGLASRKRTLENQHLWEAIKMRHEQSRQTYGSPRICKDLRANGETCSKKRVAKIMNQSGIKAKMHKRFKVTTKANPAAIPAPNLLQQDFSAKGLNQRWVADFTYVSTKEGGWYVATVMDLFSRRIVGLAMSDRMKDDWVMNALQQALSHRQPDSGLVHHSD